MITWKRNRILIIAVVAAVLIAGIVVGGILLSGGSEKKVRKAIDLGMQYLSDLDYENAILSFRDAITIDPMNEEAKNNLITAYRTYAGICMADGRYDRAAELCEELLGFSQTEDDYLLLAQAYAAAGDNDNTDRVLAEMVRLFGKTEEELLDILYIRTVIQKPTCVAEGRETMTDRIAGTERERTIPAAGIHSWDEGTILKENADGKTIQIKYVCSVCKTAEERSEDGTVVHFKDPLLKAEILEYLEIPTEDIYTFQAEKVYDICIRNSEISDLSGLEAFSHLQILDIDFQQNENHIKSIAPIFNLSELDDLTLDFLPCVDDLSFLKNYPNLRRLSIVGDSFTDISPITEMKQLVYLQMDSNVMDIDLSLLSDMKQLTDLNVMGGSGDPSFLKDFHNLKFLGLQNCNVSDIGFLSEMTGLTRLWLNNNTITDLSPIENLTMLEGLHVTNNQISDLSPVRNLNKLKKLRIGRNPITDLSPIAGLKNLTELEAQNTDITDFSIAESMPDLNIIR